MEWKYNDMRQMHELLSNGTVLARIFVSHKPRNASPFRSKALISALYFGEIRMARLDRKKKEWVGLTRKFKTREELEKYLAGKKTEIERFIRAREREAAR